MADSEAKVELRTHLGAVTVAWDEAGLRRVRLGPFEPDRECRPHLASGTPPNAEGEAVVSTLLDYFSGAPASFASPAGTVGTEFEREVWKATREIPYGQMRSYGWVAKATGRSGAARAVGAALGRNPFHLVVPCHRVVAASGALTGFARGLEWKAALLKLEHGRHA